MVQMSTHKTPARTYSVVRVRHITLTWDALEPAPTSYPFLHPQVEEMKRRQHCLMFSSAGPQAHTYYVNFDTLAEYQRWHRQASKVRLCFFFFFYLIRSPIKSLKIDSRHSTVFITHSSVTECVCAVNTVIFHTAASLLITTWVETGKIPGDRPPVACVKMWS